MSNIVYMCIECKYTYKKYKLTCGLCGGNIAEVQAGYEKLAKDQMDRERNLGHIPPV